jgi:ubiquinone/menaquinone biosynthesis C-methylase UbiE
MMLLLPKSAIMPTSPIDHPEWNYHPVLSRVQRWRFRMVQELLGRKRYGRLLEVGYGSGVFMPELALRCDELHGIDTHPHAASVCARLAANGVHAELTVGSVEDLPYADNSFDAIVAISMLEYVPGIDQACQELSRVLRPGGALVVVTPGATPLWNLALRIATREGPSQYGNRRATLQPTLRRHFDLVRQTQIPRLGPAAIRLYTGLHLTGRKGR